MLRNWSRLPARCLATWLVFMAGCAHEYTDSAGVRHVVGFVHVAMPAASSVAQTLQARTIGVLFTQAEVGTALSFGFSESTFTLVRPDSCAALAYVPSLPDRSTQRSSP